jgi:hypothetical protein
MADSDPATNKPSATYSEEPPATDSPAVGTGRRPRPTGDEAAMPQVQIALGVFILFLFLLVLWMVWPVLSR